MSEVTSLTKNIERSGEGRGHVVVIEWRQKQVSMASLTNGKRRGEDSSTPLSNCLWGRHVCISFQDCNLLCSVTSEDLCSANAKTTRELWLPGLAASLSVSQSIPLSIPPSIYVSLFSWYPSLPLSFPQPLTWLSHYSSLLSHLSLLLSLPLSIYIYQTAHFYWALRD